jgi:hypothetical protein
MILDNVKNSCNLIGISNLESCISNEINTLSEPMKDSIHPKKLLSKNEIKIGGYEESFCGEIKLMLLEYKKVSKAIGVSIVDSEKLFNKILKELLDLKLIKKEELKKIMSVEKMTSEESNLVSNCKSFKCKLVLIMKDAMKTCQAIDNIIKGVEKHIENIKDDDEMEIEENNVNYKLCEICFNKFHIKRFIEWECNCNCTRKCCKECRNQFKKCPYCRVSI